MIQIDKAYSRAANIYGLVIFPKALGHVDNAVSDLFDRLDKRVTPVPAILAETFRSLTVEKVSYRVFSEDYFPLKEFVAIPRQETFLKKSVWQFSKVSKKKTLNGRPLG
ncbi:hypothetical protein Gogos_000070 [Gossypium gossypioides]|uniref:Uncharacterized protein n=1 Tax=Gossypium gossypioides TaxID=34282 RepID=A0A7J9CYX8_GOSGO|nr:hypothetical protein [Gossypium gossypioides]